MEIKSNVLDSRLFKTEYFQKYSRAFEKVKDTLSFNPHRNFHHLVETLESIHKYNQQHAKSFTKRLIGQQEDFKSCEAVYSEMIVYRFYLKLYYEGLVKTLNFSKDDCDLCVERADGSKMHLEIFCIMPDFPVPEDGQIVVYDVKTHTQEEVSSIRQKLIRKIEKQKQFSKIRENYAVIELNNTVIAGDFSILSSLSSGYKVTMNRETMKIIDSGYDWKTSIFDNPSTSFLKGIIYFNLGDYDNRRIIINPNYKET